MFYSWSWGKNNNPILCCSKPPGCYFTLNLPTSVQASLPQPQWDLTCFSYFLSPNNFYPSVTCSCALPQYPYTFLISEATLHLIFTSLNTWVKNEAFFFLGLGSLTQCNMVSLYQLTLKFDDFFLNSRIVFSSACVVHASRRIFKWLSFLNCCK